MIDFFQEFRLSAAVACTGTIGLFLALSPSAHSQMTMTNGSTLVITSGSTLVSNGEFILKNGANIDVQTSGHLVLKDDLTNENAASDDLGSGIVECNGTASQNISGQNEFGDLYVNNANGITLSGNTRINGALQLTNGLILIGDFNLLLGELAIITGTPGNTRMIVTNGTGQFRKEFQSGYTGAFTFPIGDNTSTNEYSPVDLDFNSALFGAGNYAGVQVADAKYPDPNIQDNYLTRYWVVTTNAITGFDCDATYTYLTSDVVGSEADIVCAKVNTNPWVGYNMANTALNQISADGLTSFSSFTGVDGKVIPPVNRTLVNLTIPYGTTTCYSAQQILTVAGGGNTFIVQNGGNVTLVAGSKILLLPGTKVYSGGYLHGYITTDGTYCTPVVLNPGLVSTPAGTDDSYILFGHESERFIKLYPNPTRDDVTLEIANMNAFTNVHFEIYGMRGEKILQEYFTGIQSHKISLSDYPVGIYVIHVIAGDKSETAKIIKQ